MSDVLTATIHRPLRLAALNEYVKKAAAGEDKVEPADVKALLAVKVACRSVTRRQAHVRGGLREATFDWLEAEAGIKRAKIDLDELDEILATTFMARMHSCDILAAIVWEECEGFEFGQAVPDWLDDMDFWQATEEPADWPVCKDWLFSRLLGLTWEANPQWALAQGVIPLY